MLIETCPFWIKYSTQTSSSIKAPIPIAANLSAFSNIEMTIADVISKRNFVTARGVFGGNHTGIYEGVQPTGKTFSVSRMGIFRIAQGKIVEIWMELNERTFFEQLGLTTQSQ